MRKARAMAGDVAKGKSNSKDQDLTLTPRVGLAV